MKVLVINTYGGSLLLGATAAGAEIVGSYEGGPPGPDGTHGYDGFGTSVQQVNFPSVDCRPAFKDWPKRSLKDTMVIAHPPCAAFSRQNVGGDHARGPNADAFQCTKLVLDYAMTHRAEAIAVESVTGAMLGAWKVHDQYARDHGYHVYRVLQNSITFGVPQWRDRFWIVFVRKGTVPDGVLNMSLEPRFTTVRDTAGPHNTGPAPEVFDRYLEGLKRRLTGRPSIWPRKNTEDPWTSDERYGPIKVSPTSYDKLVNRAPDFDQRMSANRKTAWGGMSFDEHFWNTVGPLHASRTTKHAGKALGFSDWTYTYVTRFSSSQLHYLNPAGFAPVLLGSSWWYLDGRNVSERAYKAIMGFPVDYQFPGSTASKMTTFLSKGVVPNVARWIVDNVTAHLERRHLLGAYKQSIAPGRVGSFRISRSAWPVTPGPDNTGYPPLRSEDEDTDE